jgi:hypothetical protein
MESVNITDYSYAVHGSMAKFPKGLKSQKTNSQMSSLCVRDLKLYQTSDVFILK